MQWLRWAVILLVTGKTFALGAEEAFSRAIPPADFSAAGLGKLSAEEIARLDALVRDFRSGALERARREAAAAEARAAQAEAKATATAKTAAAREKPSEPTGQNLLARAKVLLMPGTEIEYATVESHIVGEFRGWEGRTVFRLENGQRWQAAGSDTYVLPRAMLNPAVKITPGALGSFWLTVEGVKSRVKVALIAAAK